MNNLNLINYLQFVNDVQQGCCLPYSVLEFFAHWNMLTCSTVEHKISFQIVIEFLNQENSILISSLHHHWDIVKKVFDPAHNILVTDIFKIEFLSQNKTASYGVWSPVETFFNISARGAYDGYDGMNQLVNNIYNLFENVFITDAQGRCYYLIDVKELPFYQDQVYRLKGDLYGVINEHALDRLKQKDMVNSCKVTEWVLLKNNKLSYVYNLKLSGPYGNVYVYVVKGF